MSWQYSWGHLIRNDLKRSRNLLYSYNINSELKIDNINCIQRSDEKVQYGATNAKNLNYNQGGILWPWVLKTVWSTKADRSRVYIRPKTLNSEAFFVFCFEEYLLQLQQQQYPSLGYGKKIGKIVKNQRLYSAYLSCEIFGDLFGTRTDTTNFYPSRSSGLVLKHEF